jgi:hypothetical protein
VALARALVLDPSVLLLDEPFSALDADLRERMRELVRRVQRELGITTLFVTHDQQEALDVADAVALLLDGRLEAHGPPARVWTDPPTLRAARFLGGVNEVPGELAGTVFTCALGHVEVAGGGPTAGRAGGPAGVRGRRHRPFTAEVADSRFRGTHRTCELKLRGGGPPGGPHRSRGRPGTRTDGAGRPPRGGLPRPPARLTALRSQDAVRRASASASWLRSAVGERRQLGGHHGRGEHVRLAGEDAELRPRDRRGRAAGGRHQRGLRALPAGQQQHRRG